MSGEADPPGGESDPFLGRVLQDRYRILARVAAGGMGTVYRAERVQLGRVVAVKFLNAAMARNPQVLRRFELEARAMSRLAHPNCISVIDFGVDELPYLVMDYVEGVALRDAMMAGPLAPARAIRITRQILAALAHAHAQAIIHRDIKPDNILLEQTPGLDDHVRILDFGLAKLVGTDLGLTVGLALGTPNYMAPEQARDGNVDERVDLYATGIVLFEMLTGKKPFDAPEVGEIFMRQIGMPAPRLGDLLPGRRFSAGLEALVQRAMAKLPDDRFASATAMADALEAVPEASGGGAVRGRPVLGPSDRTVRELLPPRAVMLTAGQNLVRTALGARRLRWIVLGAVAVLAVLVWLLLPSRTRVAGPQAQPTAAAARASRPAAPGPAPAEEPAPAPPSPPAVVARPASAAAPAARAPGEIARLVALRRSEPRNAEHASALARLYLERHWWSDGLEQLRAAIRLDPKKKNDPVLIDHAISALQSEKAESLATAVIRELGPAARPRLQQAAKSHASPRVRARATALLSPAPRRKPFLRWR